MKGPGSVPLRVTLVAALLLLVAVGLAASGLAVTTALQNTLLNRVDTQLEEAASGWARPREDRPPPPSGDIGPGRPPTSFYVRSVTADGTVRTSINDNSSAGPDLTAAASPTPVTVGSAGGGDEQCFFLKLRAAGRTAAAGFGRWGRQHRHPLPMPKMSHFGNG